ncbi:MAG: hypothetical protein K6F86_09945 [Lachnospiraceae bacterium]|nr:hypothetical protein [Lachnospiraceae bacterium]
MKKYIFFGYIGSVGGSQGYMNNKKKYLEEHGWDVHVFEPIAVTEKTDIPWEGLAGFNKNRIIAIEYPPEFWPAWYVKHTINRIWKMTGGGNDEFVIETITPVWAEWGELIAEKFGGKNFCFLMNEGYRSYNGDRSFFEFKLKRGELYFTHERLVAELVKDVDDPGKYVLPVGGAAGTVQDIYSRKIDEIKKKDYNILYVGRLKSYCAKIKEDIKSFCAAHMDKEVQLIVQGDIGDTSELEKTDNLDIIKLGYSVPIPKMLYGKADVVIAGAGSAAISSQQNVPVIVPDTKTHLAAGLRGYEGQGGLFGDPEKEKPFDEMLEDVLIKRIHETMKFSYIIQEDPSSCFEKQIKALENSEKSCNYYHFESSKKRIYTISDRWDFTKKFIGVRVRTTGIRLWNKAHDIKVKIRGNH